MSRRKKSLQDSSKKEKEFNKKTNLKVSQGLPLLSFRAIQPGGSVSPLESRPSLYSTQIMDIVGTPQEEAAIKTDVV